jgi:hypothetical protein
LSLNPEKTRIIEFGRFATERRERRAHLFVLADTIQCFVRPKGGI